MSEDTGIDPRTVATSALAVRRSNHYRPDLYSAVVCFLHWKNKCMCVLDTMMEAGVQTATAATVMNMPLGNPIK